MMGNILACVMAIAAVGAGVWIWVYERCGTTKKAEYESVKNIKESTKMEDGKAAK